MRLAAPGSVLIHSGGGVGATAWFDQYGRLGTRGCSPSPINTGWGGGIHSYGIEAEASMWCRAFSVENAILVDRRGMDVYWVYRNPNVGSDARLKSDIRLLDDVLDRLERLRGASFLRNGQPDGARETGVIAQDVEAVFPELVRADPASGMKGVDYGGLTSVQLEAIHALRGSVSRLEAQLAVG